MSYEDTLEGEILSCPECKSENISKSEDIAGVEYSYNLEKMEDGTLQWEQADTNNYGDATVTYTCNECKHEWS